MANSPKRVWTEPIIDHRGAIPQSVPVRNLIELGALIGTVCISETDENHKQNYAAAPDRPIRKYPAADRGKHRTEREKQNQQPVDTKFSAIWQT